MRNCYTHAFLRSTRHQLSMEDSRAMLCSAGTESHALVPAGKRGPWRRQRIHASSWRPPWLRAREALEMAFSGNDLRHGGAFRFALASIPFPWFDDLGARRIVAALARTRAAHALRSTSRGSSIASRLSNTTVVGCQLCFICGLCRNTFLLLAVVLFQMLRVLDAAPGAWRICGICDRDSNMMCIDAAHDAVRRKYGIRS